MGPLPPVANTEALEAALSRVPDRHREDAVQEAWLAHLEGRDPVKSIKRYANTEYCNEKRAKGRIEVWDEAAVAIERDGTVTPLSAKTHAPDREV